MDIRTFTRILGAEFYAGVPDSQLKALCSYLMSVYGLDPRRHLIAANEGNAVGLAAGYHLATGKVPAVYMQNSGLGNIINPVASLLNDKVYGIPCIFIVGWRGEPGVHDEPQHIYQGEVTLKLLEDMDIAAFVLSKETGEQELEETMERFRPLLAAGKQVAFVVRKNALETEAKVQYGNGYTLLREEVIRRIAAAAGEDVIVSTTGKASRELFEIRQAKGQGHERDFLTVGSMGHASSIALGMAAQKPERRVWIVDGDGAALMHMGAMAVIGAAAPKNIVHIVLNNEAHETVGGMPTAARTADLAAVAKACGYPRQRSVSAEAELDGALAELQNAGELSFLEVKCALGARADLGRPTLTPQENKRNFMRMLSDDPQR